MARKRKKTIAAPKKTAIKSERNLMLDCDQDETIIYGDPSTPKYNFMGGSCQISNFVSYDPRESGEFSKEGLIFRKDYYPIDGVYGIEPKEVAKDENLKEIDTISGILRCESIVDSSEFIKRNKADFDRLWQTDAKTSREALRKKDFNQKDKAILESIIRDDAGRKEYESAKSGKEISETWKNTAKKYVRTPVVGLVGKEQEIIYSKKLPISSYIPKNWVDNVVRVCKGKIGRTSTYTKCDNAESYQYMIESDLEYDDYVLKKSNLTKQDVIDPKYKPKAACVNAREVKSERKEVKYPNESRSEILSLFDARNGNVEMTSNPNDEYICQMKPVVEAPYRLFEDEAKERIKSGVVITEQGFLKEWREKGYSRMTVAASEVKKGSKIPFYAAFQLYNRQNGSLNGVINPEDINRIAQRDGINCNIINPKSNKLNKIGNVVFTFSGYKGEPVQVRNVIDGFSDLERIGEKLEKSMQ